MAGGDDMTAAQSIQERYTELLRGYMTEQDEKFLWEASELGREMVLASLPAEDVAELHAVALHAVIDEMPKTVSVTAAELASPPLAEVLMAYGLAFRAQVSNLKSAITELKEHEAALRESEHRYESITANVPGVVYRCVMHADGSISYPYVSPGVRTLYEVEPDDVLADAKLIPSLIHPDDRERLYESFRHSTSLETWNQEFRLITKSGAEKWINTRARIHRSDEGEIVWDGFSFDISERKRSEEALQEKTRLIQLLQTIVVAANEAATVDEAMQVCLDAVCAHTGWPVGHVYMLDESDTGELVPTNLWHLDHPEEFKTFQEVTRKTRFMPEIGLPGRVLASGEPAWITDVTEDPNFPRAKLAQDIGVKAAFGFPVIVGKSVVGVLEFFSTDVVERDEEMLEVMRHVGTQLGRVVERAQAEKAEAQLRQAQKMEAVGNLTGGIAHDFNNLLTVILGNLQLLEEHLEGDTRLSKRVRAASKAAMRGADLTKRLLSFGRRQVLESEVVDLNRCVAGMDDLLRRTLGEHIEIETGLAGDLWLTRIDPHELENTLLNLTINARDAMPEGGQLTIETANARLDEAYAARHEEVEAGDYAMLAVTDSGGGMPPEVADRVFEPFFTTKETGKGSGLGLSMVYGFVKQSGGHIKIYSEMGHGTTLKLYFPREASGELASSEAVAEGRQTVAGNEVVLVVEDDPDVRETAVMMLERLGYRVLEAEDGPAALRVLERHPGVDLLFTDLVMPGGMGGVALALEVRKRHPNIGVIYTSGYAEHAVGRKEHFEKEASWIAKPYDERSLAEKLRATLDR